MSLDRRKFIMGALAAPAMARKERTAPRPNIVLIVADGLGSWMLGCHGNREIRTPNIDLFAQQGARFQNHFACTPADSPSLATLFTGRVPRQHGIQDFLTAQPVENPPQGQAGPPPSFRNEVMLSDILAGVGYECGYVGNWHLGNDETPQHGFGFWYTLSGASYQDPKTNWNGQTVSEHGYLASLLTAKAGEFLDRQAHDKPFFLTVSYLNPHPPYEGHPPQYAASYANVNFTTTGWEPASPNALRGKNYLTDTVGNIRKAAASITALDDQIAQLLSKIRQRGAREDTVIVLAGTGGYLLGRHGLWTGGLASDPINMYEEVVQAPMIWHWLGKVPPESVRPELVSVYDFVPTMCDLVDVPAPPGGHLCGRSYLPLLLGKPLPKKTPWRRLVFGQYRNTEMARDVSLKLVLRNGGRGPNELFDLAGDPHEKVNHVEDSKYMNDRERMTFAIESWRSITAT